jgi:hypothetical protein
MTDSSLKAAIGTQTGRLKLISPASEEEEYQAFSFGRVGQRTQLTVGFRKADGFSEGFSYSDFRGWTTPDSKTLIELQFVGKKVCVQGANLGRVLELVRQHRLFELVEASRPQAMVCNDDEPLVLAIKIVRA